MSPRLGDSFGRYAIVPGTKYAAVSIYKQGRPHCTDIKHIGDDPLWTFLPEDCPYNRAINAIHRAPFRTMFALTRECGPHVSDITDKAAQAWLSKRLAYFANAWPLAKNITIINSSGIAVMGLNRPSGLYNIRHRISP